MELPKQYEVYEGGLKRNVSTPKPSLQPHVLKLEKNLYGLRDGGLTWFNHLKKGLGARGFKQSRVDPCLFVKGELILITYVDDCIALCTTQKPIDDFIKSMQEDYSLTDDGDLSAFLGIQIEKQFTPSGAPEYTLKQPGLIQKICETVPLTDVRQHDTPADKILFKGGDPRKTTFHYRSAIGQLNFLTGATRPELMLATHQCARFSVDPRLPHEQAVKRIVRYLKSTQDKGLIMRPDKTRGLECHVDADFAGGWSKQYTDDASTCYSRTGYIIWYAGCPLIWASKMQTVIALSTTEAEYVALSAALRDVTFVMQLLDELISFGVNLKSVLPTVKCKVFEDNVGAIELAKAPRMRPRTKHIDIQYHHFREAVQQKKISILHVSTKEQVADIATKPLPRHSFQYLRKKLMGW
jgi:hypothetical protein